jgi:hypothetical protein
VGILGGGGIPIDRDLAYNDVVDAWKHYVANDNQGAAWSSSDTRRAPGC